MPCFWAITRSTRYLNTWATPTGPIQEAVSTVDAKLVARLKAKRIDKLVRDNPFYATPPSRWHVQRQPDADT